MADMVRIDRLFPPRQQTAGQILPLKPERGSDEKAGEATDTESLPFSHSLILLSPNKYHWDKID